MKNPMNIKRVVKSFYLALEGKKIVCKAGEEYIMLELEAQNSFLKIPRGENKKNLLKVIGNCFYRFRKGVGYKGEVQRLQFQKIDRERVIFTGFKKENKRLIPYKEKMVILNRNELKFIYPLVLSPHLQEEKLSWYNDYLIFPYEFNSKKPIPEEIFKKIAPNIYNYLQSNKELLIERSRYNDRIQKNEEFYGLIRVGRYTYGNYFVAIRDNTRLSPTIIGKIKTHWGEEKIPIFDNHVSYISLRPDGKFITKEEAEYIVAILRNKKVKYIVENIFDLRSISSRLPIRIDDYYKTTK